MHSGLHYVSETCFVIEKKTNCVKPRHFPFKYLGKSYNRCTSSRDPDYKTWCSTQADSDGNHLTTGGYWGHCGQDCGEHFDEANDPNNGKIFHGSCLKFKY